MEKCHCRMHVRSKVFGLSISQELVFLHRIGIYFCKIGIYLVLLQCYNTGNKGQCYKGLSSQFEGWQLHKAGGAEAPSL